MLPDGAVDLDHRLGVHYSANRATADELVEKIVAAGGRAIAVSDP